MRSVHADCYSNLTSDLTDGTLPLREETGVKRLSFVLTAALGAGQAWGAMLQPDSLVCDEILTIAQVIANSRATTNLPASEVLRRTKATVDVLLNSPRGTKLPDGMRAVDEHMQSLIEVDRPTAVHMGAILLHNCWSSGPLPIDIEVISTQPGFVRFEIMQGQKRLIRLTGLQEVTGVKPPPPNIYAVRPEGGSRWTLRTLTSLPAPSLTPEEQARLQAVVARPDAADITVTAVHEIDAIAGAITVWLDGAQRTFRLMKPAHGMASTVDLWEGIGLGGGSLVLVRADGGILARVRLGGKRYEILQLGPNAAVSLQVVRNNDFE